MVIECSACPGRIQTGARTVRSPRLSSTMSPVTRLRRSANAGLISAALSHVSLLIGLGHSCNQPLLANPPSQILGSGRQLISRSMLGGCLLTGTLAGDTTPSRFRVIRLWAQGTPAIHPA